MYYQELHIHFNTSTVKQVQKLFGKNQQVKTLTKRLNPNHFTFSILQRSGKTKYMLQYQAHSHQIHDLLVIQSEEDKEYLAEALNDKIVNSFNK